MSEIVNRVAKSPLVTIDLDEYLEKIQVHFFDLKPFLFQEMILREKDFRQSIKEIDWQQYNGQSLVIGCSADAIIPTWAYMLVASKLSGIAKDFRFGDNVELEKMKIDLVIEEIANADHTDQKVVIKGCGNLKSRDYAFTEVTKALLGEVSSIMYGEPCSTVPVYKRPKIGS